MQELNSVTVYTELIVYGDVPDPILSAEQSPATGHLLQSKRLIIAYYQPLLVTLKSLFIMGHIRGHVVNSYSREGGVAGE